MNTSPFKTEPLEDKIICNGYSALDANYKQFNQYQYMEQVYTPYYYICSKDFGDENKLRFPASTRTCDKEVIYYRGRNNDVTDIDKKKNDFLIPVCDCNTYDNGLVCDAKKCCTKSHQLFFNVTRRNAPRSCKGEQAITNKPYYL
jgi:hypothetical protein